MGYIFGDVHTGAITSELTSLYGVSLNNRFGGGEFRGTLQLDQTGQDNETLVSATSPGRSYVIAERNGVPIWGGIIRSRTYQSQSKTVQLFANTFDKYPEYRLVLTDFLAVDEDQISIFLNLYAQMQAVPNSVLVNLSSAFSSGITKSLEVFADEYKIYDNVLRSLSDADDGFDWTVRVRRQDGVYIKDLLIGAPTLGAANHDNIIFEYPGNILNYWKNETMSKSATSFYGIGAGEGSSMITSQYIHTDLLSSGFPLYEQTISYKDIEDEGRFNSIIASDAISGKPPKPIFTVECKANIEPVFGAYTIGDACTLIIKDPRHPNTLRHKTRILAFEYYPPSSERTEEVRLTFEGDEGQ